jgi:lipoprotein-anchoring transpeptidase ErfK/SrfK
VTLRRALAVCVAVAVLIAVVVAARPDGGGAAVRQAPAPAAPRASTAADGVPAVPASAFEVGRPVGLHRERRRTTWIAVRHPVRARRAPRRSARTVARLPARTVERTTNLVVVRARRRDARGRLWVQVDLPVLPNGTRGWVPRRALGATGTVTTRLTVDLKKLTATLTRGGRRIMRARVGVGAAGSETPRGEFLVRAKLTRFASPFYGPVAFGTSARSPTQTDWPGGGFVGIHGTNQPQRLPGRVSHGCIRLRNRDMLRLSRLMPVGTRLVIR